MIFRRSMVVFSLGVAPTGVPCGKTRAVIKKTTQPITDHGCVSVYDSHISVGGFHLISFHLAQVMELENIVANTVYLKARESEYRVGICGERIARQRPKALRDCDRLLVCMRSRALESNTVVSLSDSIFSCI